MNPERNPTVGVVNTQPAVIFLCTWGTLSWFHISIPEWVWWIYLIGCRGAAFSILDSSLVGL